MDPVYTLLPKCNLQLDGFLFLVSQYVRLVLVGLVQPGVFLVDIVKLIVHIVMVESINGATLVQIDTLRDIAIVTLRVVLITVTLIVNLNPVKNPLLQTDAVPVSLLSLLLLDGAYQLAHLAV